MTKKSEKKLPSSGIRELHVDGDIVEFKATLNGKIIEDRCKLSGIKNIVAQKIEHPNLEIFKEIIKSLGGKKDETATD